MDGLILAIFCYKMSKLASKKESANPLSINLYWASFFLTLNLTFSFAPIALAVPSNNIELLYWTDFFARILLYVSAAFTVQVAFYLIFPRINFKVFIFASYAIAGTALATYQLIDRNIPSIGNNGIINWHANPLLAAGMMALLVIPWILLSVIFIFQYIKDRFRSPKPLMIGAAFAMISLAGVFQDLATDAFSFIFCGVILATGFLLILAGLYYEN